VEQVDGAVLEVLHRVVEGGSKERREGGIVPVVVLLQLLEDVLPVESRVLVAAPGVDRVGSSVQPQALDGLAKREIREASVRTELHQHTGTQRLEEPERKGGVFQPVVLRPDPVGWPE